MSIQTRQSQIVNNFFTFASIVILSIVLMLYAKYGPEEKRVNSNLECQKITFTTDKIFNEKNLLQGYALMEQGAYEINGGFIKPRFGKSYLKDKISIEEADLFFSHKIAIPKAEKEKLMTIKYEIVENDKNDPRKKDESCKLHAGSLMTSFRVSGKEFFRVHTDFLQYDKNEIKKKIECTLDAFKYNAKK